MKNYEPVGMESNVLSEVFGEEQQKKKPVTNELTPEQQRYNNVAKIGLMIACTSVMLSAFLSILSREADTSSYIIERPVEASETAIEETDISPVVEYSVDATDVVIADTDISALYRDEINYIAKTVYGEARGNTKTEQAAVVWTILNRVDSDLRYMPDDIISVVTQDYQYIGYNPNHPVTDDIVELVEDVLIRWTMEKNGAVNVGRVLPKDYLWFYGDGKHNYFTNEWRSGNNWGWDLTSPY